jgi:hypothetical protein
MVAEAGPNKVMRIAHLQPPSAQGAKIHKFSFLWQDYAKITPWQLKHNFFLIMIHLFGPKNETSIQKFPFWDYISRP